MDDDLLLPTPSPSSQAVDSHPSAAIKGASMLLVLSESHQHDSCVIHQQQVAACAAKDIATPITTATAATASTTAVVIAIVVAVIIAIVVVLAAVAIAITFATAIATTTAMTAAFSLSIDCCLCPLLLLLSPPP
jgi:hypothetical protein